MANTYPTGYSQTNAIAMVQARTNYQFGQPSPSQIVTFLNAAVEQVQRDLGQILAEYAFSVTEAETTTFNCPEDVQRILDMTYSTGPIGQAGTSIYNMQEVPYASFADLTDQVPVGGPGGIPSIYAVTQDTGNILTFQVYPYVSTGYVNIRYEQRPALFSTDVTNGGASTTTLDSSLQEAMILWACARAAESREDDAKADRYQKLYDAEIETRAKDMARKRRRSHSSSVVRDVSVDTIAGAIPFWW